LSTEREFLKKRKGRSRFSAKVKTWSFGKAVALSAAWKIVKNEKMLSSLKNKTHGERKDRTRGKDTQGERHDNTTRKRESRKEREL